MQGQNTCDRPTAEVPVWSDGLGGVCLRVEDGVNAGDWRLRDQARLEVGGTTLYRLEERTTGEERLLSVDEAPWLEAPVVPVDACAGCGGAAVGGTCQRCAKAA